MEFKLHAPFQATGDQPEAIEALVRGVTRRVEFARQQTHIARAQCARCRAAKGCFQFNRHLKAPPSHGASHGSSDSPPPAGPRYASGWSEC